VMLQVQDTGIGIAAEHLDAIFERFYQVDGTTRRTHGGCGLGLALVKEIVERHGGAVAVESQLGRGSTFTVWLPLGEASDVP
jgi:signal transduction histidine kinase